MSYLQFNTQEVRQAARRVKAAANSMNQIAGGSIKRRISDVSTQLQGDTADALIQVLSDLSSDISGIAQGLERVSNALYAFARKLEEDDQKLKQHIISR